MTTLTEVQEFRFKLYPRDFAASNAFYKKTLGFSIVHEWDRGDDDKGVMFKAGPAIIELLSPEGEYQAPVGCDLSLEVPDVWKLWDYLQSKVTVVFELRDNDWGDSSFAITDPEGFGITFFTRTA